MEVGARTCVCMNERVNEKKRKRGRERERERERDRSDIKSMARNDLVE